MTVCTLIGLSATRKTLLERMAGTTGIEPTASAVTADTNGINVLQNERLKFDSKELPFLSIAAGINVGTMPSDDARKFRKDAEVSMYKAKAFTKEDSLDIRCIAKTSESCQASAFSRPLPQVRLWGSCEIAGGSQD